MPSFTSHLSGLPTVSTRKENQVSPYFEEILRDPNGDEPRYKYAKWLSGQRDSYGQFIRLQLRIIEQRKAGSTKWFATYEQAEQLEAQHSQEWLEKSGLSKLPVWKYVKDFNFHRGMIEEVTIDARKFLEHADQLFAVAPIRHLTLMRVAPVAETLFTSTHLQRIVSLSLRRTQLGDSAARYLAESPYVSQLAWLDLSFNDIGEEGLAALAESSKANLASLEYVEFLGNNTPDPMDEYSIDPRSGTVLDSHTTPLGSRLEEQFGSLKWLHAPARFAWHFPPSREDFPFS